MNADDIAKLRAEKPREFDALAAVKLHGWRWRGRTLLNHRGGMDNAPGYSTDPASDYATLAVVQKWHVFQQTKWGDTLAEIVQNRIGRTAAWWPAHIKPGDYSHAALLAAPSPASGLQAGVRPGEEA